MSVDRDGAPSSLTFLFQVIFCMQCEDFMFYIFHKLMHRVPYLYQNIHKLHHTHTETVSISGEYAHPFEYFLTGVIPSGLSVILLGKHLHFCGILMYSMLRVFETVDSHSGYEFPWSPFRLLPMSNSARYHDFHHRHHSGGNYSSLFSVMDWVFGGNQEFIAEELKLKAN